MLSSYALSCGCVETRNDGDVVTKLWREHGVYHVRSHDHVAGKRIFWDSFRTVTEARRHFRHVRALIVARRGEDTMGQPMDDTFIEPTAPAERACWAIAARIKGSWDNPALVECGPMTPDTVSDIQEILEHYGVG